jgi:glutamyl-tRNA synthetase
MRNYLVRLGWSKGDSEILSTEEMIKWFDIDHVGRSAARIDFPKLENLNAHYMRATDDDTLLKALLDALPHLPGGAAVALKLTPEKITQLRAAMTGLKERAKTLVELLDGAGFIFAERPIRPDANASAILDEDARRNLKQLGAALSAAEPWSAATTEAIVRNFAEEHGLKLGKAAQPLRAALTGRVTSPGIFDVLSVLGRDESLARIADQARG